MSVLTSHAMCCRACSAPTGTLCPCYALFTLFASRRYRFDLEKYESLGCGDEKSCGGKHQIIFGLLIAAAHMY